MNERWAYLLMLVTLPLAWMGITAVLNPEPMIFPPLSMVLDVIRDDYASLAYHTRVTMGEALVGYAIANLVAIILAVAYLYFPSSEAFSTPWLVVIKNVPFPAVAAILVVTMDDTIWPKVIIVVLICFFPILANLSKGLRSVDTVLLDRMHSLAASRWTIFRKVRWPAAVPYYMAAHENAFTASIIGAIVGEWLFAQKGLGYLIVQATTDYRGDRLYAVTLISSLVSIFAYLSVRWIEGWWLKQKGLKASER